MVYFNILGIFKIRGGGGLILGERIISQHGTLPYEMSAVTGVVPFGVPVIIRPPTIQILGVETEHNFLNGSPRTSHRKLYRGNMGEYYRGS